MGMPELFAVAAGVGCAARRPRRGQYVRLAGAFGLFQWRMPIAGWHLGASVHRYIAAWAHWVAFALLAWVGGSMLRSALFPARQRDAADKKDPTAGANLLILAVATSIDAFAVGLSFSMLRIDIWAPAALIGCVCAALSAFGLLLGARLARAPRFGKRAECAVGLALIAIGCNILRQHGVF
jgi:putative Mn2+ efflux pump MntP